MNITIIIEYDIILLLNNGHLSSYNNFISLSHDWWWCNVWWCNNIMTNCETEDEASYRQHDVTHSLYKWYYLVSYDITLWRQYSSLRVNSAMRWDGTNHIFIRCLVSCGHDIIAITIATMCNHYSNNVLVAMVTLHSGEDS